MSRSAYFSTTGVEHLKRDFCSAIDRHLSERFDGTFVKDGTTFDDAARQLVSRAYELHNRNKTHTASALGVGLRTLHRWLDKWGIT